MPLSGLPSRLSVAGAVLALLATEAALAQETGEIARLHRSVGEISATTLPSLEALHSRCGSDVFCAAELLADALAPHGRMEQVRHPSSDVIRGVESQPSIEVQEKDGWRVVRLHRFGRKVVWELREALQGSEDIILDLRDNTGGDFDRMLRVAGLFCGEVIDAVRLQDGNREQRFSIMGKGELRGRGALRVWIGRETASSAEVLAALLKRYGNARLLGEKSFGKDVLLREIAVSHEWRLLVPAGRLKVNGVMLQEGVMPDGRL